MKSFNRVIAGTFVVLLTLGAGSAWADQAADQAAQAQAAKAAAQAKAAAVQAAKAHAEWVAEQAEHKKALNDAMAKAKALAAQSFDGNKPPPDKNHH